MRKIRVLVADDSPLIRDLIRAMIEADPELEVAGEAVNGLEAVEKVRLLRPDIVTMDLEMPVLDGLQAIERIMCESAVPILVVTTRGDAATAYAAIAKGALDLMVKPDVSIAGARDFTDRLRMLSKVRVLTHIAGKCFGRRATDVQRVTGAVPAGGIAAGKNLGRRATDVAPGALSAGVVVAVAASTGGPDALSVILSRLPPKFPVPIVIAQHISDGFVSGMVGWLKTVSRIEIKIAVDGEALLPGVAYVCPPENHMRISRGRKIVFVERHPKDIFRPSCDTLLTSVGESCGAKAVGVILTGMGNDGVAGMKAIKAAGGVTLAQDEKTSVIFGMPNLAIASGCIDRIVPLGDFAVEIARAAVDRGAAVARPG